MRVEERHLMWMIVPLMHILLLLVLQQIHDTLKIWVGDQKYSLKMEELERVLVRICSSSGGSRIEYVDGVYQLTSVAAQQGAR